ncbi:hypothetical protein N0V90_003135 [Kalmusia sp. IMI 367209]|nr:hypothetical protein N0V90_003135 [Kalmusia sp. IMI 367209]
MLDTYLTNSEAHPHLHPDALITPSGATFSAQGGPTGGVVMHNLRRVAAGLRGEYLEPEPSPEPEEQSATTNGGWKGRKSSENTTMAAQEDWQNMSEFEREEGMIEEGGEAPELEAIAGAEEGEGEKKKRKGDEGKLDKEARKKAKKAKDKEFRAKKEKARTEKSA